MPPRRLSLAELLEGLRAFVAEAAPGELPVELRLVLSSGRRIVLPVPPLAVVAAPPPDLPVRRHGPDFRSVSWDGVEYAFTPTQAVVVRLLWEAWEDGTPDVGQARLLEEADCTGRRLRDVFRDHPAWGRLIIVGEAKGTYRLAS